MQQLTPQQKERQARAQRVSIAVAGFTIWAILAALCIAAFWQHIDSINPAYPRLARAGAIASEITVFFLVYWHCFNHHIGVRKAALWLGIALSSAALVHAGALYGMSEAKHSQLETEKRVKEGLTEMSKEQMGMARGRRRSQTQQELAKNAQKEYVETVKGGTDKVIASSILPEWYLRGGMYAALFILSLICSGICVAKMQNNEDIDANFDGRPDHLEQRPIVLQPPPGGPFMLDREGNVVWAPGYGPSGTGHRPGSDSNMSEFPAELDARPTGRLPGK